MYAKLLNVVLVASCASFLTTAAYAIKLNKIYAIVAIGAFVLLHLHNDGRLFFKKIFEKTRLNKAIYCFLFIALLATVFGISPYESQKVLLNRYFIYFVIFFIGVFLGRKEINIKILIAALLLGSIIVSIGGIVGMAKTGNLQRMHTSFGLGIYGTYFLYTLPFFIGFILFHPSIKVKIFSAVISLPVFTGFFLHGSRGVWLGLFSAVIVTAVLFGKNRKYLACLFLICAITLFSVPSFREKIFYKGDFKRFNVDNVNVRFQMWQSAINIAKKYPILGAGPGSYGTLMYDFYPGEIEGGRIHLHAHNTYLETLANMGILGLLSFLWIFFLFFLTGYKSIKVKMDFNKISFMLMFLALAVSELFMSVVLVGITQPIVFWFLLGAGTSVMNNRSIDL
jgi:putative inorganic carbon (hco3(-)) transporter